MKTAASRQARAVAPEPSQRGKARKPFFAAPKKRSSTLQGTEESAAAPTLRLVHSQDAIPSPTPKEIEEAEHAGHGESALEVVETTAAVKDAPASEQIAEETPAAATPVVAAASDTVEDDAETTAAAEPSAEIEKPPQQPEPAPTVGSPAAQAPHAHSSAASETVADRATATSKRTPAAPSSASASASAPAPAPTLGPRVARIDVPAADLQLSPPVDAGPAERIAPVVAADLSGSSERALTGFIDATPSAMAAALPALAPTLGEKLTSEQQAFAGAAPVLSARTAGTVSGSGGGTVSPAASVAPAGPVALGDGLHEADPGPLPEPAATAPEPFQGNAEANRALEEQNSPSFWGGLWDQFTAFLGDLVDGLKVRDEGVATSAGAAPKLELRGAADPARTDAPMDQAGEALGEQHAAHASSFRDNPGQARIQPRALDEACIAASGEADPIQPAAQFDEGVADYVAAPLPQNVRELADSRLASTLTPNLASARAQTLAAAELRDSERANEIDDAQAATARMNAEADTAQRKLIIEKRSKVAQLQAQGIAEADAEAAAFEAETASEQTELRSSITEHVEHEETLAEQELQKGENKAEQERLDGERRAAAKKEELKREQKKDSWWTRTTQAITKAVKALTAAIDTILTAVRKTVAAIIDTARTLAIGLVNKARTWVVSQIDQFRVWLKDKTERYLQHRFPELAKRINAGIDEIADGAIQAVNEIADVTIESINKLADELAAALDSILAGFQSGLKVAVQFVGAVMQGDFAAALRIAVEAACAIVGVSPAQVFEFFDRAGQAIVVILKDPVGFIGNLFRAVSTGIGNFFGNIGQHLITGVIGWLTGALAEIRLTGPFEFSPRGVLSIVLQVLGLTYANIKARVIKKVPQVAPVFNLVEKGCDLLQRVLIEGPVALWNIVKEKLSDLKETVLGAIRSWLSLTAIKEGVIWLLSLTNPASALAKIVKLVFDLVAFLTERYQQIKEFVLAVYGAVNDVLANNFGRVSLAVENALSRALPVLISLFASVLGLGNISKEVRTVISTITAPVNNAIDWVIDRIAIFAKAVWAKIQSGARKARDTVKKLFQWWKTRAGFTDQSGEEHTLSYKGKGKSAQLYVASCAPSPLVHFLQARLQSASYTESEKETANKALIFYNAKVNPLEEKLKAKNSETPKSTANDNPEEYRKLETDLENELTKMGVTWLHGLFKADNEHDFPPPRLPAMVDNKKAASFKADYIIQTTPNKKWNREERACGNVIVDPKPKYKYKYSIVTGSESNQHISRNFNVWGFVTKQKRLYAVSSGN